MTHEIAESWDRIVAWLQANAPETLERLQPPASQEQLDAVASQMSLELPDEFKVYYQIADGNDPNGESSGIFPARDEWEDMAFGPLALRQIVQEWNMQKELLDIG